MKYNYTIEEGKFVADDSLGGRTVVKFTFLFHVLKLAIVLLIFGITVYLTYLIFKECISDATLANCIPLGSIFATFGSAVISVISLYCNKQIQLFQENLTALHEQTPDLSNWSRWSFLKRYSRKRTNLFRHNYYILKNPQIIFYIEKFYLAVPIPTCTADFYDLPILVNLIKMGVFHKSFHKSVVAHQNIQEQKDMYVFYCILKMYINIIKYKAGAFLMLFASEFVLTSIIFSFFYKSINEFILLIIANF